MRRMLLVLVGLGAGGWMLLTLLTNAVALPVVEEGPTAAATECTEKMPAEEKPKPVCIHLPIPLDGTSLVAEAIVGYEGPFLEDGSDEMLGEVTALLIRNAGDTGVEWAWVVLERGGLTLNFEASCILPGETVLVLERDKKICPEENFSACWARVKTAETDWELEGVTLREIDMGRLEIRNETEQDLDLVLLDYKGYDGEREVYIGGITYRVEIRNLRAGEQREFAVSHYAAGYSRVVAVRNGEPRTGPR